MKNILLVVLFLFGGFNLFSQSDLSIIPSKDPNLDSFFPYYPELIYSTGSKIGLGYGVFRELKPNLDLTANASINWWQFNRTSYFNSEPTEVSLWYFNLSIGERFRIADLGKSRLYTGINLNNQFYFGFEAKKYGLGIEPNISWSMDAGKRHEFYASLGYDQHVISFDKTFDRRPGKVSLSIGFNFDLQKPDDKSL